MLAIRCVETGHTVFAECSLQPGGSGCGKSDCAHRNPHAEFDRQAPDHGCCPQDHDCQEAANSCPAQHEGQPCPWPENECPVWAVNHPHLEGSHLRDTSAGPCPGGHCAKGVEGCTVCHPLHISVVPGSITLRPVAGA